MGADDIDDGYDCECYVMQSDGQQYIDKYGLCNTCWEVYNRDFYENY